jgi:hypothetical protein
MFPFQTFKRALYHVCHDLIQRLIWHDRILNLWERGRKIKAGFDELEVWRRNSSIPFALVTYQLHRLI